MPGLRLLKLYGYICNTDALTLIILNGLMRCQCGATALCIGRDLVNDAEPTYTLCTKCVETCQIILHQCSVDIGIGRAWRTKRMPWQPWYSSLQIWQMLSHCLSYDPSSVINKKPLQHSLGLSADQHLPHLHSESKRQLQKAHCNCRLAAAFQLLPLKLLLWERHY